MLAGSTNLSRRVLVQLGLIADGAGCQDKPWEEGGRAQPPQDTMGHHACALQIILTQWDPCGPLFAESPTFNKHEEQVGRSDCVTPNLTPVHRRCPEHDPKPSLHRSRPIPAGFVWCAPSRRSECVRKSRCPAIDWPSEDGCLLL